MGIKSKIYAQKLANIQKKKKGDVRTSCDNKLTRKNKWYSEGITKRKSIIMTLTRKNGRYLNTKESFLTS